MVLEIAQEGDGTIAAFQIPSFLVSVLPFLFLDDFAVLFVEIHEVRQREQLGAFPFVLLREVNLVTTQFGIAQQVGVVGSKDQLGVLGVASRVKEHVYDVQGDDGMQLGFHLIDYKDFTVHQGAYYDITHGEGLAIITPRWMRHILNERTMPRFMKYGINVFGIDASLPPMEIANRAIDETYRFFESIGIPMHLREVGIDDSRIDEMAHHIAVNEGLGNAYAPLTEQDIKAILIASL